MMCFQENIDYQEEMQQLCIIISSDFIQDMLFDIDE